MTGESTSADAEDLPRKSFVRGISKSREGWDAEERLFAI
jgi:hypothetical protein